MCVSTQYHSFNQSTPTTGLTAPKKEELEVTSVPDVEWWDEAILNGGYAAIDAQSDKEG